MSELTQLFAARLEESVVSVAAAKHAGLKLLEPDAVKALWAGAPRQGAIQIPYLSPAGRGTGFYRLRLLGVAQGLNGQSSKPRRYLQPPESGVRAYLPRVKGVEWLEILSNPEIALIITEGEFKALSATLHGFPTIGLGGVENWRSAKARKPLIDELESCNWKGRHLYIAYDSDVSTKPQVAEAARKLADVLGERGAHVYDAGLPGGAGGKVGLDDFLRDRGPKVLANHLQEAPEFESVRALHEFNERFVFIREASRVYEPVQRGFYDAQKFMATAFANAVHNCATMTGTKLKLEKRQTARDWITWPHRRTVQRVTYAPGNDALIIPVGSSNELNLWRGWGCSPKRGDLKPWKRLFEHLTSGEPNPATARSWLEKWLAYPLQHPGAKLFTAVAVHGAMQGSGKTMLGETMLKIYGENGVLIGQKQLGSSFNGWMERKQFILGDEITGNDNRQYADELKGLLTGKTIRVNEKFEREYDLPNCVNFYFTSNHADAFFLEDSDRRFFVLAAPHERLEQSFYDEYRTWMDGEGPAAVFEYLLRVDTKDFHPRAPAMETFAKEQMIDIGRSEASRFVAIVMLDPQRAEKVYGVPQDVDLFTAAELRTFYDPHRDTRTSEKAISIELQKQGAVRVNHGQQILIEGQGRFRFYAVRNRDSWKSATLREILLYLKHRKLPTAKY